MRLGLLISSSWMKLRLTSLWIISERGKNENLYVQIKYIVFCMVINFFLQFSTVSQNSFLPSSACMRGRGHFAGG